MKWATRMVREPSGKKLGRNEPCWCGSTKKFKNCHLNRVSESPVTRNEAFKAFQTSFGEQYCSCAPNKRHECRGEIVKAHSLSRKSALGAVTEDGHVFSLTPHWNSLFHKNKLEFRKKSARAASTFTGFCGYHDHAIFSDLDQTEFNGSKKLSILSAYRTLCREIFVKKAHIKTSEFGKAMDRGRNPFSQFILQEAMAGTIDGANSALEELSDLQGLFEQAIETLNFDNFSCKNFHFKESAELVSSGTFNPTHTMSGKFLQNLQLETYSQNLCFGILPSNEGCWATFLWNKAHTLVESFVNDFEDRFATAGGAYAFASAHIENTFYRPSFWEDLKPDQKADFQFLSGFGVLHHDYAKVKIAAEKLSAFRPTKPDSVLRL